MNDYFKLPLEYIGVTTYFSDEHPAVDFGWNKDYGQNPNIYSIAEGVVIENGYNESTGYRVWIRTDIDDTRYLHRYCHLKEKSSLTVGSTIKRGDLIGIMGSTGNSTGNHLHLDLWKCPKDYIMDWNDREKYSVDPLKYCYLFDDQAVSSETKEYVTRVVGQNIKKEKNPNENQLQVINPFLRARTDGIINDNNIIGYIDLGIYNYLETKENNSYIWYKLDENLWIAKTEDVVILTEDTCDEKMKSLKEEILKLDKEILELKKENEELKKLESLNKFTCLKEDYYYIYLKENESVYYN